MFDILELGDMVWMPTFNRDGSTRRNSSQFGVVDHVSKSGLSQTIKRFNPKTGCFSGPSLSVEHTIAEWRPNRSVMLLAKFNDDAGRDHFQNLCKGVVPPPTVFRPFHKPPIREDFPIDPRHFTRQSIITVVDVKTGKSITVNSFEHSTPYPDQFVRNLHEIKSGGLARPFRATLTYYGPISPLIEGSEDGEVIYSVDIF